jgi:signal transduction histidine kinase
VRKIIDQHDGTITLDSQPGCGAKFTVILPGKPAPA